MTDFFQIIIGGEPLIWSGDGECRWFEETRAYDVLHDIERSVNPRLTRVWRIDPTQFEGPYSPPHVIDVTREVAERMVDAKLAVDAHCIDRDTQPERFFGAFAYFHQSEYCDSRIEAVQEERAEYRRDLMAEGNW